MALKKSMKLALDSETSSDRCKCLKIEGHLEAVKWPEYPREYIPSAGYLAMADFTDNPFIWMHYIDDDVTSLGKDDILKNKESRYWSIHDVQRYFLGSIHCEQILFTYQYPNLRMSTRFGSHLWKSNVALKLHNKLYWKELTLSTAVTLKRIELNKSQMSRLIICDQLIKLDRMDYQRRKTFFKSLLAILSFQDHLQLVSLENMGCERLEGVSLLQQLAVFNADSLKYLYLWRFVLPNQNPILINYTYITGSGQYYRRPSTTRCFLRSLASFRNLRVLAVEYSNLADDTGGALLSILPVIKRPYFWLQMICREDQIPGKANPELGCGGLFIPDSAWQRVAICCPDIHLMMVFFRIRHYDDLRRFLTPHIPLREVHLEYGIDVLQSQRQDSDVSCFFRHIAYRYANTLLTVSFHQWRFATFPLRRVFELMPNLVQFYYVGLVDDDVDLKRMLNMIACGVCIRLKDVGIQIQHEERNREFWQNSVTSLTKEYSNIFVTLEIKLCLSLYKQ